MGHRINAFSESSSHEFRALLDMLGTKRNGTLKLAAQSQGLGLPNVMNWLGRAARATSFEQSLAKKTHYRVAVCSTGHLRTFVQPGVYSGLVANLLQTLPGTTDLFLTGHLGYYAGSADASYTIQDKQGVTSAYDEALTRALKYVGLNGSQAEITQGDCSALQAAWRRDGITGRYCNGQSGDFMQIMWLDHCIRRVRQSGTKYDVLVRMRPDVGIFKPIYSLDRESVSYMQKDAGGKADWFFTVPWATLETWWDPLAELYSYGGGGLPDYTLFEDTRGLTETDFPVAIVRGRRSAQCFRLVHSFEHRSDCYKKAPSGYFGDQIHQGGRANSSSL